MIYSKLYFYTRVTLIKFRRNDCVWATNLEPINQNDDIINVDHEEIYILSHFNQNPSCAYNLLFIYITRIIPVKNHGSWRICWKVSSWSHQIMYLSPTRFIIFPFKHFPCSFSKIIDSFNGCISYKHFPIFPVFSRGAKICKSAKACFFLFSCQSNFRNFSKKKVLEPPEHFASSSHQLVVQSSTPGLPQLIIPNNFAEEIKVLSLTVQKF